LIEVAVPPLETPLLEAIDVSKRFGTVTALERASLAIRGGEATCLLGDNGAGKSTLVGILSGVHAPSGGQVRMGGKPVAFGSPGDALARGVATVYQDLAVIPLLSVWRNFFLGSEPTRGRGPFRRLDVARCRRVARAELDRIGIDFGDPDRPVGTLSGGERQAVAIARALHFGARVLILDEPTAALGVRQVTIILDQIVRAKDRGVGIVLVTHNPQHAFPVGDRFVILRRGHEVGSYAKTEESVERLAALMAGE
jgi:simple sugar transport system ATP-binding protein